MFYKQVSDYLGVLQPYVQRSVDGAFIPFDPANTDYQQFKIQVADGTPLEDPEGNVMSAEQVSAFLETLP